MRGVVRRVFASIRARVTAAVFEPAVVVSTVMARVFEPTVMVSSVMAAVLGARVFVPAVVVSTVAERAAVDLMPRIDGGVAGIVSDGWVPTVGRRRSVMTAPIELNHTGIRAAAREQHTGDGRGYEGTK